MVTRREFLDTLAVGAAGLAVGTTAKSYGQILGSNDRLNFAVIGLNGRAYAHLSALKANRSAARISHVCDVDSNILRKFADSDAAGDGRGPGNGEGLSQDSRAEGCGRHHDCHSRPLAYADGHRRVAGGQARLCGKAVQPQSGRGSAAGAGAAEVWKAGADGHAAALFAAHHRDRREDSRRRDRQALLRQGLVQQHAKVDRHRQGSARAAAA